MISSISSFSGQNTFKGTPKINRVIPKKTDKKETINNITSLIGWGTMIALSIAGIIGAIINKTDNKTSQNIEKISSAPYNNDKAAPLFNEIV